jgi:hypothetical protein
MISELARALFGAEVQRGGTELDKKLAQSAKPRTHSLFQTDDENDFPFTCLK